MRGELDRIGWRSAPFAIFGLALLILIAGVAVSFQFNAAYGRAWIEQTQGFADVLAASAAAAVDFDDPAAAQQAADAYRVNKQIRLIGIYNRDGKLVAGYDRSGRPVAPTIDARLFGAACGLIAVIGLVLGIRSSIGIWRERITGPDSFFDMWWYGIIPAGAYIGLGAAAAATLTGQSWSASAVAAALMVLLLVSIHAEWDLVTFLAPRAADREKAG